MSRFLPAGLLAALLAASAVAQEERAKPADKPPADKPASSAKPVEVVAVFHDGTTIRRAALQDSQLEVTTKYGKLSVPLADVRRIDFGRHVTEESTKKVDDLVGKLSSEQFAEREKATRDLATLGVSALPALEKAAKSGDTEVAKRARTALDQIRGSLPPDRLAVKDEDVLTTKDQVITGKIGTAALRARTEYFGEMTFKLTDLRSVATAETEPVANAPFNRGGFGQRFPGAPPGTVPPGGFTPPQALPAPGAPPLPPPLPIPVPEGPKVPPADPEKKDQ